MFGLKDKEVATINAAAQSAPMPIPALVPPSFERAKAIEADLGEYAAVALEVGVDVPQLVVEDFVAVLERLNYPIYNRTEVVAYMDKMAKKDDNGYGWEWRPVRNKDHIVGAWFGTSSRAGSGFALSNEPTPASDYYVGPRPASAQDQMMMAQMQIRTPAKYDKVIPLHALKRIAAIEKEYTKPVHFLVSDYATEPHVRPDPFLMAVIPGVPSDMGRFVIDFWDEPGFGIGQMLK